MQTDVLIIGCGIAGATAALELARDRQRQIVVITRSERAEGSNSSEAQGGIIGPGNDDTAELLAEDMLRAGAGLSYPPAVRVLAQEGPRRVREILVDRAGVGFDREGSGRPALGLEGAHSRRRILHVGDATGRAIMCSLLERLAELPNVTLRTGLTGVDLVTFPHHALDGLAVYEAPVCHGAYAFEQTSRRVVRLIARHTLLATGGLGQIFRNTTNPPGARGDGLAMAWRAGARVVNAEYVQFHPTALHMAGTQKMLITEALRGEGGVLLDPQGRPFMERYAATERELAPRDVVARAIYAEMLAHEADHVYLDIATRRPATFIRERFPAIHAACLERGIDITRRPIPVAPAAHYHCGGVLVDLWGRTTLPGLYAAGEVSCTGVHGANRLASASLLEGLVWGARAAEEIRRQGPGGPIAESRVPAWDESGLGDEADPALIQVDMQAIRNLMWHYVGLMRSEQRLNRALRELVRLRQNIEQFYRRAFLADALIGLRNAVLNAVIVARAALHNPTSRGCHYRGDVPPTRVSVTPIDPSLAP